MSLEDCLQEFRDGVVKVNRFIDAAHERDNDGEDIFGDEEKDFLVESAFLKLFIYWEQFLEGSFCKYLTGMPAIDGSNVEKYAAPINVNLAHRMLIGTQKYVDWANVEIVKRLALIYFPAGNAISENIRSVATELADMRTIRNSCAHASGTTQTKLYGVAQRLIGSTSSDVRVREIILAIDPSVPGQTFLQSYQQKLDVATENICSNAT